MPEDRRPPRRDDGGGRDGARRPSGRPRPAGGPGRDEAGASPAQRPADGSRSVPEPAPGRRRTGVPRRRPSDGSPGGPPRGTPGRSGRPADRTSGDRTGRRSDDGAARADRQRPSGGAGRGERSQDRPYRDRPRRDGDDRPARSRQGDNAAGGRTRDRDEPRPSERARRDGARRDGASRDGAGRDGARRDGARRDGARRDGAGRDGARRDGASRDGAGRDGARRDGDRRAGGDRNRSSSDGGRRGGRSSDGRGGASDRRYGDQEGRGNDRGRGGRPPRPLTEAEKRSAEVRRRREPKPELTEQELADAERAKIEARTTEEWIDEGSTGTTAPPRKRSQRHPDDSLPLVGQLDPTVVAAVYEAVGTDRGVKLADRLAEAATAIDRDRLDDARRLITPLLKEIPSIAAVQEIAGLIAYGQHRWAEAAAHLELAQRIDPDVALLPVLADVYRAQARWNDVSQLWAAIRAADPSPEVLAEGRIVAASSLADQGRLESAVRMMAAADHQPNRIQPYHLRQWYVLGDLYDRAGDQLAATGWFRLVIAQDPDFADTTDRLRDLGR